MFITPEIPKQCPKTSYRLTFFIIFNNYFIVFKGHSNPISCLKLRENDDKVALFIKNNAL